MYYEYTENCTNSQLMLSNFVSIIEKFYDKPLILVFSNPTCAPCKQLSNNFKSIFNGFSKEQKVLCPNIIKLNAELLCDNDLDYINKYPTTFLISENTLKNIDINKPLMEQIKDIDKIIGLPQQSFYDENNLTVDF